MALGHTEGQELGGHAHARTVHDDAVAMQLHGLHVVRGGAPHHARARVDHRAPEAPTPSRVAAPRLRRACSSNVPIPAVGIRDQLPEFEYD